MKMRTNYLARAAMLLLLAVLGSAGAWADVVTIGNPSVDYGHMLPIGALNNYALTQQVYTADEINHAAGKIWSIGFNTVRGDMSRHLSIYVTHTNESGVRNYTPPTANDLYYSGDMFFKAGQWNTLEFTKPFTYNGSSNLLITICDDTGERGSYSSLTNKFYNPSSTHLIYATSNEQAFNPTDANAETDFTSISSWKAQIQLAFGDYPTPSDFTVTDIGNVSAQVQCSLRGNATAWNLRYRKAGTEEWTTQKNLTTRSKTLEGLTAATDYEAQVQAVFANDHFSDWTSSIPFTTNCCPVEQQAEIRYVLWGDNRVWKGFAVQILDVTEEDNPVEVAYLNPPGDDSFEGYLTLCCSHKYKVNWIYDENNPDFNQYYSVALYYDNADLIYRMATGDAPEEDVELTTFVVDCGDYCTQMPKNLSIDDISHDNITISFTSTTGGGKIAYSTEADFNPATATNTQSVNFVPDGDSGSGNSYSYKLTGLEPVTDYYVAVQSLCSAQLLDDGGKSRWTKPVKVKTGPEEAPVEDITVVNDGSSKSKVSWTPKGTETKHNVYVRRQTGEGKPISNDQIMMFNLENEEGATFENWGGGTWSSLASSSFSNILQEVSKWFVVTGLQEGDVVKAAVSEGNSKSDPEAKAKVTETYSMGAESLTKGLDAEAKKTEVKSKIKKRRSQRNSGKLLTRKQWKNKYEEYKEVTADWISSEEGSEEEKALEEQVKDLKRELGLDKKKVRKAAKKSINAGYKSYKKNAKKRTKTRGTDDEQKEYFAWINHEEGSGYLSISDLEIVSGDDWSEWEVIEGVSDNSYTFNGLTPGTTYEIIIEPVYDDGTTGSENSILFTTLGEETDPVDGEFSVGAEKKVQFAKGNLRYEGDMGGYEATWSMAKQQYEVLGDKNIDVKSNGSSYPADLKDLLCWSTTNNYYGVSNYYWRNDEDAAQYFQGDFVDWGENPALIADLGEGWSTLSKDEWTYLLTKRENADRLQSFATISYMKGEENVSVKGLILMPDDWTGDAPAATYTAETWKTLEAAGAVFLPVTGHLWSYEDENGRTQTVINGIDVIGNYWTSTPAGDKSDYYAFAARFNLNDSELTPNAETERRLGCAIRLVKTITPKQELQDDWIIAIDDLDCTDSDQMPTLIVKDGETTLQEGVDYTVTYTNNKNVGTATATITFVEGSKYIGTASVTFNILRDMSNVFSTNNSWATYVAKEDLTTPDGLQAYTISAATASEVTATPIDYIPVGLAVLLNRADASVSAYKAKAYTETPAIVTSLLVGSAAETTSLTPYQDFILFNDEFVLSSAASVAAGHAYLPAAKVPAGARTMTIVIDGEATAINSMKITTADNDGWYTVDGRQLNRMPAAKGVYIHHGKKYVIK